MTDWSALLLTMLGHVGQMTDRWISAQTIARRHLPFWLVTSAAVQPLRTQCCLNVSQHDDTTFLLLLTISDNPERQLIHPVWKAGATTVLRPLHPPSGPIPHRSADFRESPAACLGSVMQGVCHGESVMSPIGCCQGRYRLSARWLVRKAACWRRCQ